MPSDVTSKAHLAQEGPLNLLKRNIARDVGKPLGLPGPGLPAVGSGPGF